MSWEGRLYSHSHENVSDEREGFEFDTGDEITVEFDPVSFTLSYSKAKSKSICVQPLLMEDLPEGDVYYCVGMKPSKGYEQIRILS
jgi:hypothetical protein